MAPSFARQISDRMHQIDQQILSILRHEDDERLRWSDGPTSPPIAFHVWHVARYADRTQAMLAKLAGDTQSAEIWEAEQIASEWGLDASKLGGVQTGMGMSDTDSANLTLPSKADLLAYAEWAIRLLEEQLNELDDAALGREFDDGSGNQISTLAAILSHLTHASRHLGMMEALRGVQGERGTASS